MTTDCRTQLASLALGEAEKGDYIMASKILTTGIRLEPNKYELYFERSICYHRLGDYRASLDDANEAILLNSSDYAIHYQKGLALIGLSMLPEAIKSFKKAIELRAKQEDTRLSDIFKLLRDAMNELTTARGKLGLINTQALGETVTTIPPSQARTIQQLNHSTAEQTPPTPQQQPPPPQQQQQQLQPPPKRSHPDNNDDINSFEQNKKLLISTSSSSMPATNQPGPSTSTAKDDSYSSKYKRLRRDRERARRGTSKLCTIKLSDLEDLHKSSELDKRTMRVIAPIDGWLYSGTLSYDHRAGLNLPIKQYIVKLDGDPMGSGYLFNQETVLSDVIKEVSVKSVSELRKGARICCYWSRQYKCLSTGVVTSRTFEATKSLVSVKYDNGDLSALPLEDLRLLPPDYPKYMSNCDPLLLARNGDGIHPPTATNNSMGLIGPKIVFERQPATNPELNISNGLSSNNNVLNNMTTSSSEKIEASKSNTHTNNNIITQESRIDSIVNKLKDDNRFTSQVNHLSEVSTQDDELHDEELKQTELNGIDVEGNSEDEQVDDNDDDDDDATIPPTDETIDFITSEITLTKDEQSDIEHESIGCAERISLTKDNISMDTESQLRNNDTSRSSSEENSYRFEYCPWVFEGSPKRSKRHGRTYRDNYLSIRRGNEVIRVGDSAELMPRDESILPFIAKIDGFWSTPKGEMRVRVRWYYRLIETEGDSYELHDGENALFETDHFDENDVQSIYRSTKILSWTDYEKNHLGHVNKNEDNITKIFYLAGYYDPVRRIKHLRTDVKEAQ